MHGKFIVGRDLSLPSTGFENNSNVGNAPESPEHFVQVPDFSYQIGESTGILHKLSNIAPGTSSKTHRNFRWLPWIPGKISYVALEVGDVLSGKFTGCWLVVFTINRTGVTCVGHIGTEEGPTHPKTLQVKSAWRSAVSSREITPIKAINPVNACTLSPQDGMPSIYGLVTPAQEMYAVVMTKPYKGGVLHRESISTMTRANPFPEPQFSNG